MLSFCYRCHKISISNYYLLYPHFSDEKTEILVGYFVFTQLVNSGANS